MEPPFWKSFTVTDVWNAPSINIINRLWVIGLNSLGSDCCNCIYCYWDFFSQKIGDLMKIMMNRENNKWKTKKIAYLQPWPRRLLPVWKKKRPRIKCKSKQWIQDASNKPFVPSFFQGCFKPNKKNRISSLKKQWNKLLGIEW